MSTRRKIVAGIGVTLLMISLVLFVLGAMINKFPDIWSGLAMFAGWLVVIVACWKQPVRRKDK